MTLLGQQRGIDAHVLELTILTAVRTNEATKARWEEIDIDRGIWSLSGERTKTGKTHRVPLSSKAIDTLNRTASMTGYLESGKRIGWIFPGRKNKPVSNMIMLMLLRRLERTDITVQGFRSTFRDWAAEKTGFVHEVIEGALAHALGNHVELAYLRSDLLEKCRGLMDAWALECSTATRLAGK